MFIDPFTARPLSPLRFTRPVFSFVCTHMKETANKLNLAAEAELFIQPKNVPTWPLPLPLASWRDDTDREKHCKNRHKSSAPKGERPLGQTK